MSASASGWGWRPSRANITPHVTLARLKNTSPEQAAHYLSGRGDFSAMPFKAARFVLMSSRDSVGGGPYVIEEAYPLNGAAAISPAYSQTATMER